MILCLACRQAFAGTAGDVCPACGASPERVDGFLAFASALAGEGGGFRPEYFAGLAKLEENNFWFRARNRLIQWALQHYQPLGTSYLEIGCGTGYVLSGIAAAFPARKLWASEVFVIGLGFAAQRVPQAVCLQMDAREIPFLQEFDAIGAFDVLEHIPEDEQVLQQIHDVLETNGLLLLTVPQHAWLWSPADDYACHVRRYSAVELHGKLEAAGFSIVRSTSFVSLLLPAMMLSRLLPRSQGSYDPVNEFRLHPVLNRLFEGVLLLEQAFIRLGFNWPLGGSRLVIARKRST